MKCAQDLITYAHVSRKQTFYIDSAMTSPPKARLLQGPLISLTCPEARCLIGQTNSSCTPCYHSMAVQIMPATHSSMGGLVVDFTFVTHISLQYNHNQMLKIKNQCYCRAQHIPKATRNLSRVQNGTSEQFKVFMLEVSYQV